jgi:HEAT repeat protein
MAQSFRTPDIRKLEEKHNVKKLIKALSHSERDIRAASAAALGRIGDPTAIVPLIKALKSDHVTVINSAARALGQIGNSSAVPALRQMLNDRNELVRWHAVWALEELGDIRATESLDIALGKERPRIGLPVGTSTRKGPRFN